MARGCGRIYKKAYRVIKKLIRLGPYRLMQIARARIRRYLFIRRTHLPVHHTWQAISGQHSGVNFVEFLENFRARDFSWLRTWYAQSDLSRALVIACADDWLKEQMHPASSDSKAGTFFAEIDICVHQGRDLGYDVRSVWEMGRFTHAWCAGYAYQISGDACYANALRKNIAAWINNNPYLIGVHWVCPMEVALRAINWSVAGAFLINDASCDEDWWQDFLCSAYDHYEYLWYMHEVFDSRTNNHYLADLVGGLYLCWMFEALDGSKQRARWYHSELLKELDKQLFLEGTSYEGSTAYHALVTELVHCAYRVSGALGLPADKLCEMRDKMVRFVGWSHNLTIGDDDSSRVLSFGLPKNLIDTACQGEAHYPEFGLSIFKVDRLHVSLRHHAYRWQQPSGHFHNDVGSITLALDGKHIFIDPGSYVYTASAYWRNYFRSVQMHNTFFLENSEPVKLDNDLFVLNMPENSNHYLSGSLHMQHGLYEKCGILAHRVLEFDQRCVMITDWWEGKHGDDMWPTVWNFTLAPDMHVHLDGAHVYIDYQQRQILELHCSGLNFFLEDGWISPCYGKREITKCLRAKKNMACNAAIKIVMEWK